MLRARQISVAMTMALVLVSCSKPPQDYDLVINNGRVIDPETNYDQVSNVGIKAGTILTITKDAIKGKKTIDATGLIVAPGFIDPHSHAQLYLPGQRMQAFDGVTTALELESGILPIGEYYSDAAKEGRPINYGAAAAWTFARIMAMVPEQPPVAATAEWYQAAFSHPNWTTDVSTPEQLDRIIAILDTALQEGALGIGVNGGYVPGAGGKENQRVWELGAKYSVPVMTHMRNWSLVDPRSSVEMVNELIGLAASTGARTHIFHLHSSMMMDTPIGIRMLEKARATGVDITTEAYPYGIGSTVISSAPFLRPQDELEKTLGLEAKDFRLVARAHQIVDDPEFRAEQKSGPGQIIILNFLDEQDPQEAAVLDQANTTPWMMIGSDAMPWNNPDGSSVKGNVWPLTKDMLSHPRSAGNYSKFLREYVRERKLLTWMDAFRKGSLMPAQMLEKGVPVMKKKGRVQVGMDADLTVFDPNTITDRATVDYPAQPSEGVKYLVVNGQLLIEDGKMDLTAFPGKPVRR